MISIVPADDSVRSAALQGAFLHNQADCLVAMNNQERLGYVFYSVRGDTVELLTLQADDAVVADGLIRSALNSAFHSGASEAICKDDVLYNEYLYKLGFTKTNRTNTPESQEKREYSVSIRSVLNGKCKNHI